MFPDHPLPAFVITRRLDGMKPVQPRPDGTPRSAASRRKGRVRSVLVLLLLALVFGGVALLTASGLGVRLYGSILGGTFAAVAARIMVSLFLEAARSKDKEEPEVSVPGALPEFAELFAVAASGGASFEAPSESAQRWLVEHRDTILRVHSDGARLGIAFLPVPGSRPGYPTAVDEKMLDRMMGVAAGIRGGMGMDGGDDAMASGAGPAPLA